MKVAKFINKHSIEVLDFESTNKKIEESYQDNLSFHGVANEVIDPIKRKLDRSEILSDNERNFLSVRKTCDELHDFQIASLREYKTLINAPQPAIMDTDEASPFYNERSTTIEQVWEINHNIPEKVKAKIQKLKSALAATDYVVIKYYESLSTGATPIVIDERIISERQGLRDEINNLKSLLS